MDKVDQFESAFRSATKPVFVPELPVLGKVLVVTDLPDQEASRFGASVRGFLGVLGEVEWALATGDDYRNVADLLQVVEDHGPDLVVTYRHLQSDAWKWPFSLGEHLDVLTQAAGSPVLVTPHPTAGGAMEHALVNTDSVMAITDHLTGDARLVNWSARFTASGGTLFLTHVENESQFERYMTTVGKIPSIETGNARETILAQLLKEPRDYIESCREALLATGQSLAVEPIVALGRPLAVYENLIESHRVDLLVMNTKDESQAAMHGLAYPLAVELRSIPLLLL